jgi:hypothetical protein
MTRPTGSVRHIRMLRQEVRQDQAVSFEGHVARRHRRDEATGTSQLDRRLEQRIIREDQLMGH